MSRSAQKLAFSDSAFLFHQHMQEDTGAMENTLNDRAGNDLRISTYEELKTNFINVSTPGNCLVPALPF